MNYLLTTRRKKELLGRTARLSAQTALILSLVAVSSDAIAQANPASAQKPELTAEAKAALVSMSQYLRSLKSFEVAADGTGDLVTQDGQKVEYGAKLSYAVRLPDQMFAQIATGSRDREIFYDGKKLTVSAPTLGFYTDIPATGSLAVLLDNAAENYGVELPLRQLFRWGDVKRPAEWPTSGFKVGTARCGKVICDQFAFREADFDWQIWIEQGSNPLPVRVVYTGTTDDAKPQIAANLTWNVNPSIPASRFMFSPATTANRISISKSAMSGSK